MAWSKIILSGSTDGRGILVTAISSFVSSANVIHTAITGTADFDEVYLWGHNNATTNRVVVIRWGATATQQQDREYTQTIPSRDGLHLICPGLILRNALSIQAYATVAGVATSGVQIYGYVHRVT